MKFEAIPIQFKISTHKFAASGQSKKKMVYVFRFSTIERTMSFIQTEHISSDKIVFRWQLVLHNSPTKTEIFKGIIGFQIF